MALLSPKHVYHYLSAEVIVIFVNVLLFPLLSPFGITCDDSSYTTLYMHPCILINTKWTNTVNESKVKSVCILLKIIRGQSP